MNQPISQSTVAASSGGATFRRLGLALLPASVALALALLVLSVNVAGLGAAQLCVSPSGGACYTTIQAAIDAAANDDTILVHQGVYAENLTVTKRLGLIGDDASQTVIDGAQKGHVIELLPASALTLTGATVQHGWQPNYAFMQGRGGGIRVNGGASLYLSNTQIVSNTAYHGGGIIAEANSRVEVHRSLFSANLATQGGAFNNGSSSAIVDSDFTYNLAITGGALYNWYAPSTLTLSNNTIVSNSAGEQGGGIFNYGLLAVDATRVLSSSAQSGGGIYALDALTLTNSLLQGNSASRGAGGGLWISGTASIAGTTLSDNHAEGFAVGGGIFSVGTLSLTQSTLSANDAFEGGAIAADGSTSLSNVSLDSNSAVFGGALYVGGRARLEQVTLSRNSALGGGGIRFLAGTLTLHNATLTDNRATNGGGIDNGGVVTLTQVTLATNSAQQGGGLTNEPNAGATLLNVTLSGNTVSARGGGIFNAAAMTLTQVTLSANAAITGTGGGIWNGGTAWLTNSTLSTNAASFGGGVHNDYGGSVELANSTLSGNFATAGSGGGIHNAFGSMTLTSVTLSGNSSTAGGGAIYHSADTGFQTLTLKNTIVANSPSGGNCYKDPKSATPIASGGFNLSSDNTCAFSNTGDQNNAPARLGPLANNGGFTLTYLPLPPITPGVGPIDNGQCLAAVPTDQRGVLRPQGAACDVGAVEYRTGETTPWLFLPLIVR